MHPGQPRESKGGGVRRWHLDQASHGSPMSTGASPPSPRCQRGLSASFERVDWRHVPGQWHRRLLPSHSNGASSFKSGAKTPFDAQTRRCELIQGEDDGEQHERERSFHRAMEAQRTIFVPSDCSVALGERKDATSTSKTPSVQPIPLSGRLVGASPLMRVRHRHQFRRVSAPVRLCGLEHR